MAAKYFIIDIKLNFRGHWASTENGVIYEIAPNGILVFETKILNGSSGEILTANIDVLYALREEAEGIMNNKFLKGRVVRKYVRDRLLGREVLPPYQAGYGWRLNTVDTRQIREEIWGVEEVPVSWKYIKKLQRNWEKKVAAGREPKHATYLELRDNPRFRIKEWIQRLYSFVGL